MGNNTPFVSVIVPCYKVAAYVETCLRSILSQTYSNVEIIAVDDGSPDETPTILDRLAQEQPKLKVIHQQNAGVSAARNTGIQHASGEYIMFVDGDDYLAPDAVSYFMELVRQTGAEFCLSLDSYTKQDEPQASSQTVQTLSPAEAVALLLSPRIIVGCWNKIYKRSLLTDNNCRFSTDLFYGEGLHFITTAAQISNALGVGNRKVYYYRRNNEVSATTRFNIEKIYNGLESINRIEADLKVRTPQIDTMLTLHRSMFYLGAAVRLRTANLVEKYRKEYKQYVSFVRRNYLKLVFKKEVSLYRKCLLLGGCISPRLLAKLDVLRRKRIVAASVREN